MQMGCEVKAGRKHSKDGKGLESEISRRKLVGHWFVATQVIVHLLNTLPDLRLFCTCCISQAFEPFKKC